MIRLKSIFCFVALVFMLIQPNNLCGQRQVHGLVIDSASLQPMPFVTIAVVGSTYGTISNQNGEFALSPDKINPSENIAFHYLGYEVVTMKINDLKDGMIVKISEKPFSLRGITIVANPLKPEEVIRRAVAAKNLNYPTVAQKREIFHRSNQASYINDFELTLKKSDIPGFDKTLIREMVDSLPRYSRSYEDNLYVLHSIPADSGKLKYKAEGIKNVVLKEDNGGGLENIKKIITGLFVHKSDDRNFWKYNTGPFSFKESHVKISAGEPVTDSSYLKNLYKFYFLDGDMGWNWDFIQKPNQYRYRNKGIIGIGGEDAYAISFTGKARANYQGMIYISIESFAILRIEYSLKEGEKGEGIDLLGVNYREVKDEGLILYEKDRLGYFLKYSMKSTSTTYGIDRPFEIVRKEKRPILNKKINEADLRLNLQGMQEACYETLVVYREASTAAKFNGVKEKGIKPDRITSYSDSIWKGYSIIEPTRQMKEYQSKVR